MVFKIFFITLGALLFIIYFLPVFHRVLNAGNIAGMVVGAGIFATGFLWNKIPESMYDSVEIIIFVLILAIIVSMDIVYNAGKTTAKNEAVIIVLGCRVKGDAASLALEGRIETAYRFLLSNPQAIAILSGGQGKDENISEAECMRRMLTERGIANERLILEDKSTSTDENIRFSLEIIEKTGLEKSVAAATSEYHQMRTKMICERYGLTVSAQSSKTKAILLPTFLLREVAGIIKETLLNKKQG